ncbi:hypothetical protein PF011_g13718 [Phytophthora fragariae]|uniref:Peptidase S33 tripeptidyl aminopeptidase-like C-terminal domain-containing protein n=2 Tax=Phytophthora fragariae TaxID=53985 RepID=A0A6A3K9Z2_9STRA|nr:hypothetical protein PF003_g25232 [Phytophthora fragariae]KAE9001495.1 hypothetical protein PF011_g13718 [Phytophthora fragariae]
MWESPTPSVSTMKTRFQRATLGSGVESNTIVPKYCAYSKEKSATCNKLKLGNYEGNGIIYERDEYWNKAAKIPKQASVLVMSSELDPLAPYSYAKALLETLDGAKKELINFKSTIGAHLLDSITTEPMCGMALLASFVQGDGDLTQLNRTCLDDEVALNWTTPNDFRGFFIGTDDVYDETYIPA